ncbi:hypothetical protein [Robertkochia aurantiaca]|uniref:hypothetical protein n=1 Tax=Robertkochia aurantiaca TaxID=2873700 RepID=UPI001CCF4648|nr:hypothetical protein [Robertkochia sp. 3YJGBD-33]
MKTVPTIRFYASLLLLLFIFTKTAGVHGFTHPSDEDGTEQCFVCEYAVIQAVTPCDHEGEQDYLSQPLTTIVSIEKTFHRFFFVRKSTENRLFSRPPPVG